MLEGFICERSSTCRERASQQQRRFCKWYRHSGDRHCASFKLLHQALVLVPLLSLRSHTQVAILAPQRERFANVYPRHETFCWSFT